MTSASGLLERSVAPLDGARRLALGLARRSGFVLGVVARRDRRIAAVATAQALVALGLAVLAPSLLLVLGPVLLGVIHVVADVRYLVLRRRLPRWWRGVVWAACGALVAVRGLEELLGSGRATLLAEHALLVAWVAAAIAAGAAAGVGARAAALRRAAIAAPVALALALLAFVEPRGFRAAFAHAHNVVALALWLALFRRGLRAVVTPLAVVLAGAVLLASGAALPITLRFGQLQSFGLHLFAASDWLAPGLAAVPALGLTLSYAFLQSVHYAVWLLLIPQDDLATQGTPTWRMSVRSLRRDLGGAGAIAAAAVAALVALGAARDAVGTRNLYLSLAGFHGYLEVALFAYFFVRGDLGRRDDAGRERRRERAPSPALAAT